MKTTIRNSFASPRPAPRNPTKGEPMKKLTKEQKRDIRAIAARRDRDIDFSDAPPVLDWSGAENRQVLPASRKPVTIRLDSDIIDWLKADGRGYETKANWLLRHAMLHFTRRDSPSKRKRASRKARLPERPTLA